MATAHQIRDLIAQTKTGSVRPRLPREVRDEVCRDAARRIELERRDITLHRSYDHWIQGRTPERAKPTWCVIRDILGWVDQEREVGDEERRNPMKLRPPSLSTRFECTTPYRNRTGWACWLLLLALATGCARLEAVNQPLAHVLAGGSLHHLGEDEAARDRVVGEGSARA
jgi:hypothetical protein